MLSAADFEQPYYNLRRQGTATAPKVVPLIVIAWEARGINPPPPAMDLPAMKQMIFGEQGSIAHWFFENSQGRYRIVPHPTTPIIGPFQSLNDDSFYRREGRYAPPSPEDPHYYRDDQGHAHYLDDQGFINGFDHSYTEAIRLATAQEGINFRIFDRDGDQRLSQDEFLLLIAKRSSGTDGFYRGVSGSQVPSSPLIVDEVRFETVSEWYSSAPYENDDLAVAIEEVLHQAANLADQYPDNNHRLDNDPRRPGNLALTDAGRRPVHIDPYHKLKWGWLNPQVCNRSGRYTLRDAATTGDALILYSPYFGVDEFFILENRWRGSSYDRFREPELQEGLALWHCIQAPELAHDWARLAIHLRRADPRLDEHNRIKIPLTLFDGGDPPRSYDLHDESFPQNLRFRNDIPSRVRIRNISPAGPVMTVDIEVPPQRGSIVATRGIIKMIRSHENGTGFGPPAHRLTEDCILTLDSEPGAVFGLNISGANSFVGLKMFEQLRSAFQNRLPVTIEYEATGALGGRIIRVINSR